MQDEYEIPFGNSSCSKIFTYLNNSDNQGSSMNKKYDGNMHLKNRVNIQLENPIQNDNIPFNYNNLQTIIEEPYEYKKCNIPQQNQNVINQDIRGNITRQTMIQKNIHDQYLMNKPEIQVCENNMGQRNIPNGENIRMPVYNSENKTIENMISENMKKNTCVRINNQPQIDENYNKYLEYMQMQNARRSINALDALKTSFLDNNIYNLYGYDIKYRHLLYTVCIIILCFILYKIWKWTKKNESDNKEEEKIEEEKKKEKKEKKDKKDKKSQDDSLYIPIYNK